MRIEQTAQPAEAATTIMQATIRMSCLVAAIGMGLPAGAAAQTEAPGAPADVRSEARSHLGPFYFTPGVRLKELGVDSNVFNAAGEQKSDFTFTLAPTLNVSVPIRAPGAARDHCRLGSRVVCALRHRALGQPSGQRAW